MSTRIVDNGYGAIMAVEVCDDCKTVLSRRPATEYERGVVGSQLLVRSWCNDCSPKHSFPADCLVHEDTGVCIANLNTVMKARIDP